jgi:peptidoglycan/LPS O-acetylase OafA/YrhL
MALCPVGIGRWVEWVLSWPIWHPVAQLIFSIYLFHFVFIVIGAVLTFWTLDRDSIEVVKTYQVFLIFFWAVLLTMAFGTVMHIFVEKPFLTLREKVHKEAAAPAPSPATM